MLPALLAVFSLLACDGESPTVLNGCQPVALSDDLHPIFYWGYGTLQDFEPNTGVPASDVGSPQWISSDSIMVVSIARHNGETTVGAFTVQIDPDSLTYKGVTEYSHTNAVFSIQWDNLTNSLLVLDSPDAASSRIVRCHLATTGLVVDDEVVAAAWKPSGMCLWPRRDGVVFTGIDPVSGTGGVYWRQTGAITDSLLYEPSPSEVLPSKSISVTSDGSGLLVGVSLTGSSACQLIRVSTANADDKGVVITRAHYSIAVEANPTNSDVAAFVYRFLGDDTEAEQDVVEVVELSTGETSRLNVRTDALRCHFTRVESVSWDPLGNDLAVASGAAGPEGERYRYRLWALRPVNRAGIVRGSIP